MKGFLRVYEDGYDLVSKLYWGVIRDSFLNFYKDKKNLVPTSIINMEECQVSRVSSEKYQTDLIQIKTQNNTIISLAPDNIKEFEMWENCFYQLSAQYNERRSEKVNTIPRNEEHNVDVIENRQRYTKKNGNKQIEAIMKPNTSTIEMTEYRRRSSDYGRPRPSTPTNNIRTSVLSNNTRDQRDSNLSGNHRNRGIDTVKEDPMMSDDEILETKTIDELRKKYPISDKTKRWSIAATDIVGKSNDELFLMLIQLNRERSHMDIWKETLEKQLHVLEEAIKTEKNIDDKAELEDSHQYMIEKLNEMDYMINLAHPLISFLESVVQMSDVYKGDNQTFHVVYHQHPPSGKEDFSNIDFIRHNQEREVARLINENNSQSQSGNPRYNSLKSSKRSNSNYGKENDPEIALNLKNSQKFINRKHELNSVLEDIECQLTELDPLKKSVENYLISFKVDQTDGEIKPVTLTNSTKTSLKNIKAQKPSEIKMNDFSMLPRRSTRKSPKSDMTASLNRSARLTRNSAIIPPITNTNSLPRNHSTKSSLQNKLSKSDNEEYEDQNQQQSIYDHSFPVKQIRSPNVLKEKKAPKNDLPPYSPKGHSKESRLQSQLLDLVNGTPQSQVDHKRNSNNAEFSDFQDGPLIKLDASKYQKMHRPSRSNIVENTNYTTDIRDSVSNSDVSLANNPINQRMNLNELMDDNKIWKNPGNSLATPPKVEIKDRYRGSISNESDIDVNRSERIRKQVANQSMTNYTGSDAGHRNERESMLLRNSILAHEASKRSRQL